MFKHGSVVVFNDREDALDAALKRDAVEIMKRDGPVVAGTAQGDFETVFVDGGAVVLSHNPNLVTVAEHVTDEDAGNSLRVGLRLRSARDTDSRGPEVVHTSLDGPAFDVVHSSSLRVTVKLDTGKAVLSKLVVITVTSVGEVDVVSKILEESKRKHNCRGAYALIDPANWTPVVHGQHIANDCELFLVKSKE
jgi:hypothetical protein